VSLGLETAAFEKGSRRAVQQTESLGKKMGKIAGAIGTAFVASIGVDTVQAWASATKGALEFAGSLGETAQQLGVTTNELQEFRYIATQTGIEQGQMDKALQKTTRTLGELATPTKAQAEALKELGLSAKDLAGLGTGDFITLLADKFKGLTAAQQAALGAQLGLGRGFQTMIPLLNEGSAGIERMRDEAHKLGIVISETAIQNADKNADLLSTYEQISTAQKNAALAMPENVKAYMAYEKAVLDLQLGFYKLIGGISKWADENKRWETDVVPAWRAFSAWSVEFQKNVSDMVLFVPRAIGNMVTAISNWIGNTLGKVWDEAERKIRSAGAAFAWLYDVVVGHSYIPDMVTEIGANMAKLDALMVKPAEKATAATARKFQELRDLLDRLFPESGKATSFNADLASIEGSGLSQAAKDEASARLWREFTSGSPFGGGGMGGPDFGDSGPLVEGIGETEAAIIRLTERAKIGSVRIAESFKDMADKTMQTFSRLASALKGGGFLGILEAVIGVGLQLGSMGAFGKTIATRLNTVSKVPGFANGTNFAPGGLALVGERGPELVSMPRGSKVTPNHAMGGVTNNYFSGNLMTPEFWGMIQRGDIQAAQGGAMIARAQGARSQKWSLA
jgi:soluble cytochrome b562